MRYILTLQMSLLYIHLQHFLTVYFLTVLYIDLSHHTEIQLLLTEFYLVIVV